MIYIHIYLISFLGLALYSFWLTRKGMQAKSEEEILYAILTFLFGILPIVNTIGLTVIIVDYLLQKFIIWKK